MKRIFGYMWEIIQSIYITSLEDQSNDLPRSMAGSSFGVISNPSPSADSAEIDKL